MDGRFEWSFDLSAWRPVSFGTGPGSAYLWSARELISLPVAEEDKPSLVEVDEDLVSAYRTEDGWVLVCETSVRRLMGWEQTTRLELPDVVVHHTWTGDLLSVNVESFGETVLRISGPDLLFESA